MESKGDQITIVSRQFIAWAAANLPPEDFEKLPVWHEVKDWPGKIVGVCKDTGAFLQWNGSNTKRKGTK